MPAIGRLVAQFFLSFPFSLFPFLSLSRSRSGLNWCILIIVYSADIVMGRNSGWNEEAAEVPALDQGQGRLLAQFP